MRKRQCEEGQEEEREKERGSENEESDRAK
jgi:hypothetical protein